MNIIIHCRRLPSISGMRMRLSSPDVPPKFEEWESDIPPQIQKILNGRWECRLSGKIEHGQVEILGEAS